MEIKNDSGNFENEAQSTEEPLLEKRQIDEIDKPKWTGILLLTGIASTLGTGVPSSYAFGVMNNPTLHMRQWCKETVLQRFNITLNTDGIDLLWSAIISIFLIGGAIGGLNSAWISNKFGRKRSILICGLLFLIAAFCFFICRFFNSIELLFFGRFILGIATGLSAACLPIYLCEIAPLLYRGSLALLGVGGFTIGINIGQVISMENVLGSEDKWHFALSFYASFILIYLLFYNYYPESPKWLYVIKGDIKGAERELIKLRCITNMQLVLNELESMKIEASNLEKSSSFREVVNDPKLKLPLILYSVFHLISQISGVNMINNYSVLIFYKAGFSAVSAERANMGLGVLSFITTLICFYLINNLNRRPLIILTSFGCFMELFIFGIFLNFLDSSYWCAIGCLISVCMYIFFFNLGIAPVLFFIGTEIFEVAPRSVAMSLGSIANNIGGAIACMSVPILQNIFGPLMFLAFSLNFLIISILTYFYFPETRGKTSTEISLLFSNGFKSKVIT